MEAKKTINGKYTKQARNEYMARYHKEKNETIICNICGGKYKLITGKKSHASTKKHTLAKIGFKSKLLKDSDDITRDEILRKLCDEVDCLRNLIKDKNKNDQDDIFKPTETENNL
jgi:hypothetical protein